jgi:hypothetical protein
VQDGDDWVINGTSGRSNAAPGSDRRAHGGQPRRPAGRSTGFIVDIPSEG